MTRLSSQLLSVYPEDQASEIINLPDINKKIINFITVVNNNYQIKEADMQENSCKDGKDIKNA